MNSADTTRNSGAMVIGGDFHALGIVRNLRRFGIPVSVVYSGFCISRFSRYTDEYHKCPPLTDAEGVVDFLMELAEKKGLDKTVLFPNSDSAVRILATHGERLKRHYLVPTPEWEITRIAFDKKLTYRLAERLDVPIPRTLFPESADDLSGLEMDFPVILKPTITANFYPVTQRKALRADSRDELVRHYRYMSSVIDRSEIMVQEMIQGGPKNLYSFCSLFSNGEVRGRLTAVRLRQHPMDFGSSSTYVISCEAPQLEEPAVRMLKGMNYRGLSEVEFMFDEKDGVFKLLDINPRTWAWHTLGAAAGVNFSYLLFREMRDDPVSVNSFEIGVKWIREVTDVPVAVTEILKGRLGVGEYLRSLRGRKELAVFSLSDPLPFLAELAWAPYMWGKRGFRM